MSDRDEAWRLLDRGQDDADSMTMREMMTSRLFALITTFFLVLISGILSIGEAIAQPFLAIIGGLVAVTDATFMESIQIISEGAQTAAWSFAEGTAALLGPAAFPVAVGTVFAGLYVFVYGWQRLDWAPWAWLSARIPRRR